MKQGHAVWLAAIALAPSSAIAQAFDNAAVKALHAAGLGETAIVAKINSLPCGYDVSTAGLISLKQAGLTDGVIAAMVNRCTASSRAQGYAANSADPAVPHAPGIYVVEDGPGAATLQPLRPSKASGVKVTGNGSVLMPYRARLVLPETGSHMPLRSAQPVFYFYFDVPDRRVSDFGTANSAAAQSPDEFTLVRFSVKGNQREVGMGKVSAYDIRRGIDPAASIAFAAQDTGEGVFKVSFAEKLVPGEYGFVLTGATGTSRVYDFSIP